MASFQGELQIVITNFQGFLFQPKMLITEKTQLNNKPKPAFYRQKLHWLLFWVTDTLEGYHMYIEEKSHLDLLVSYREAVSGLKESFFLLLKQTALE